MQYSKLFNRQLYNYFLQRYSSGFSVKNFFNKGMSTVASLLRQKKLETLSADAESFVLYLDLSSNKTLDGILIQCDNSKDSVDRLSTRASSQNSSSKMDSLLKELFETSSIGKVRHLNFINILLSYSLNHVFFYATRKKFFL